MSSRLDRITDWKRAARNSGYCVKALARRLDVTPRQLERHFKDSCGVSPKFWCNELKMKAAERWLHRGLLVKQVAERLRYQQPHHFTRAFERWKGIPPSRARISDGETPPRRPKS